MIGRPSGWSPKTADAEDVEHRVLRVVLVHRDLLEHDLALGVDVAERRAPDHVGDHVERARQVLVEHPRVDRRALLVGARVELGAHRVEQLVDLGRGVAVGALEEQVLEEVREPRLPGRLAARAGADEEAQGRGPHGAHVLRDDPQPRVQLGERVLGQPAGLAAGRGRGRARGRRSRSRPPSRPSRSPPPPRPSRRGPRSPRPLPRPPPPRRRCRRRPAPRRTCRRCPGPRRGAGRCGRARWSTSTTRTAISSPLLRTSSTVADALAGRRRWRCAAGRRCPWPARRRRRTWWS